MNRSPHLPDPKGNPDAGLIPGLVLLLTRETQIHHPLNTPPGLPHQQNRHLPLGPERLPSHQCLS